MTRARRAPARAHAASRRRTARGGRRSAQSQPALQPRAGGGQSLRSPLVRLRREACPPLLPRCPGARTSRESGAARYHSTSCDRRSSGLLLQVMRSGLPGRQGAPTRRGAPRTGGRLGRVERVHEWVHPGVEPVWIRVPSHTCSVTRSGCQKPNAAPVFRRRSRTRPGTWPARRCRPRSGRRPGTSRTWRPGSGSDDGFEGKTHSSAPSCHFPPRLVDEDRRLRHVEPRDLRVHEVEPHVRDHLRDDPVARRLGRREAGRILGRRESPATRDGKRLADRRLLRRRGRTERARRRGGAGRNDEDGERRCEDRVRMAPP